MPDLVLTGQPSSDSTLTCPLLNLRADTVALHEPIPLGEAAREFQEPLASKNVNRAHDADPMRVLGEKRLGRTGALWEFYPRETIAATLAELPVVEV